MEAFCSTFTRTERQMIILTGCITLLCTKVVINYKDTEQLLSTKLQEEDEKKITRFPHKIRLLLDSIQVQPKLAAFTDWVHIPRITVTTPTVNQTHHSCPSVLSILCICL